LKHFKERQRKNISFLFGEKWEKEVAWFIRPISMDKEYLVAMNVELIYQLVILLSPE